MLTIPNPLVIIHEVILPSREGNRSGCNFADGGNLIMPLIARTLAVHQHKTRVDALMVTAMVGQMLVTPSLMRALNGEMLTGMDLVTTPVE